MSIELSDKEKLVLYHIKALGKRDGYFPPSWATVQVASNLNDKKLFTDIITSLSDKGCLKVAKGKLRGIFISDLGMNLVSSKIEGNKAA